MNQQLDERDSSLLVESLQALESAVDGLCRLGLAIRQSSSINLTQRVDQFMRKKGDGGVLEGIVCFQLQIRLIHKIKQGAKAEDSAKRVGRVGATLSLCQQLATSVAFRYFGILYLRSHSEKIEVKREVKPKTEHQPTPAPAVPKTKPAAPKPKPEKLATRGPSAIPLHLREHASRSDTDSSIPESKKAKQIYASRNIADNTGSKRHSPAGGSVISIRLTNTTYPDPPKMDSMQRNGLCPYCCKRFPWPHFADKTWWE
jgi:hypothetical protein